MSRKGHVLKKKKKGWSGDAGYDVSSLTVELVSMLHDLDNSWKTAGANQLSIGFAAN